MCIHKIRPLRFCYENIELLPLETKSLNIQKGTTQHKLFLKKVKIHTSASHQSKNREFEQFWEANFEPTPSGLYENNFLGNREPTNEFNLFIRLDEQFRPIRVSIVYYAFFYN